MTEDPKPKSDSKIVVIAAVAVIAAVLAVGIYYHLNKKDEQTITLSIGDKSFSATINE